MSDGMIGHGTVLTIGGVTIGNVISISGPDQTRASVDITTMDSTGKWMEFIPGLIDGGYTSVPRFAFYETDGTWGVEGHGVDPDIEVVDDPALMVNGGDPQLDVAIKQMLTELKQNPRTKPGRPSYPDRSGMGIREEDK